MIFLPSAKFLYKPKTVAPWTPLLLPLYGWYKADVGTGVSTDGAAVSAWQDQSGNGRHLSQPTTANRMTFRTSANGIGGLPALQSAATTTTVPAQFFSEAGFAGNSGFSFYIVMTQDAYSANSQYSGGFSVGVTGGVNGIHHFCNHPSRLGEVLIRYDNLGDPRLSAYTRNPVVIKVSRSASVSGYKWKSTYDSLGTPSLTTTLPLLSGFAVGKNYIGSVGSKIAEVIVCNRELTTGFVGSEEDKLNTYLRSRYGFDLNYGVDLPVTGAALWLDASRGDTLYTDNLLTTAATTDNGPVGGWKDLSGNNRHALQTFTNRPTWRTPINGLNGLGAMSFNGVSQWLDIASFPSLASGYTFYAVLRANGSSVPFSTANAGTAASTAVINVNTSNVGLSQWGALVSGAATTGLVAGFIGNYDGSHTTGNFFVRTSQSTANTTGTMTQNAGTPAAGTAAVGRATNGTLYFNSQIYELVVLPRQSTTTEDQAWKTYTAAKWGITWS